MRNYSSIYYNFKMLQNYDKEEKLKNKLTNKNKDEKPKSTKNAKKKENVKHSKFKIDDKSFANKLKKFRRNHKNKRVGKGKNEKENNERKKIVSVNKKKSNSLEEIQLNSVPQKENGTLDRTDKELSPNVSPKSVPMDFQKTQSLGKTFSEVIFFIL